jgi:glycosyltransferase involved in cell wall biosynthesis
MQYHIRPDEKVAAIVARLNPVKGHKYFIEAAKIVKDRGIKAKFLIAGTGEESPALNLQIQRLGLEDTVIMMGFVEQVAPLMQLMDVQVNCSYGTEATSLSLLEGMSLGKPAVVTDFGGNPGVIFDGINGFLTPTHDAEATAEKLIQLFTDDALYQTLSENCKKVYETKFTAEVNTRAIEDVYRLAVKKSKNKDR